MTIPSSLPTDLAASGTVMRQCRPPLAVFNPKKTADLTLPSGLICWSLQPPGGNLSQRGSQVLENRPRLDGALSAVETLRPH